MQTSHAEDGGHVVDWTAYEPTDDIAELRAAARAHFASFDGPAGIRALLDGLAPADIWPSLVENGYTSIGLPEELDGIGTQTHVCALLGESGRALLHAPLTATAAAHQTLLAVGAADAVDPGSRSTVGLVRDGEVIAFDGSPSDRIVVVESRDGGTRVTVHTTPEAAAVLAAVDPSRASIRFDQREATTVLSLDLSVDADAVLAAARMCVAADLVGTASAALDASVGYAAQREQFGQPIGAFQAVKHRLADTYVAIERAESLVVGAAVEIRADALSPAGRRMAMLAKAAAAEAANRATTVRTQLLGAMGMTFESDSALAVRRARHTSAFLGDPATLYAQVAAEEIGIGAHR